MTTRNFFLSFELFTRLFPNIFSIFVSHSCNELSKSLAILCALGYDYYYYYLVVQSKPSSNNRSENFPLMFRVFFTTLFSNEFLQVRYCAMLECNYCSLYSPKDHSILFSRVRFMFSIYLTKMAHVFLVHPIMPRMKRLN